MRGRFVRAKYATPTTAACAMTESAYDEGLHAEAEGAANRLKVADDLVINLGLFVNVSSWPNHACREWSRIWIQLQFKVHL